MFDTLLLRPADVVRPEEAINTNWELYTRTWIVCQPSLFDCKVQNPELLLHSRGLEYMPFHYATQCANTSVRCEALPQVVLDVIRRRDEEWDLCSSLSSLFRAALDVLKLMSEFLSEQQLHRS